MSGVQCVTGCENTGGRSAAFRRGSRRRRRRHRALQLLLSATIRWRRWRRRASWPVRGVFQRAIAPIHNTRGYSPAAVSDRVTRYGAIRDRVQQQSEGCGSDWTGFKKRSVVIYAGVVLRVRGKNAKIPMPAFAYTLPILNSKFTGAPKTATANPRYSAPFPFYPARSRSFPAAFRESRRLSSSRACCACAYLYAYTMRSCVLAPRGQRAILGIFGGDDDGARESCRPPPPPRIRCAAPSDIDRQTLAAFWPAYKFFPTIAITIIFFFFKYVFEGHPATAPRDIMFRVAPKCLHTMKRIRYINIHVRFILW